MKLRMNMLCRAGAWIGICLATLIFAWQARAAAVSTTTVQGTVYLANGAAGSGTLQLSWPAFTTADNLAVAAGRTTVSIGADGFVSVNLAPNLGAAPAGLYYTAVYHMSDGTTSTEYWVVPEAAQASLAAVRAQVMPAAQAVQAASKAYVDNAIASLAQGTLTPVGGALSGPLYLNGDPTQTLQAADKHYVDSTFSASVPLAGGTMLGALTGPSVTASLNKVLLVTAPPYNAQCDGVTDDQAAIQAAFNDAYTNGYSVEFPAGTCLTSTITIKGQSFFGHGKYVTTIVGRPGQDVFATPDPSTSPVFRQSAHIHDLSIQVNATVDASASAAGGNNMFPYRVTGTAGGLTALSPAPAPGPMIFGSAVPGNCAGQMIADSSGAFDEFYQPCANFTNLNAEFNGAHMAGQPISVYNTSGALVLATTIASVIDATHLQLAAPAPAAQSNLSGEYMNALTAPWYIGNCGFAFPMADGSQNGGGNGSLNGWVFENISIGQVSTSLRQPNHTCGIFMQANNYALNYEHVDTSMLYGGIIEALPYQNGSYVTWAPDTTKYLDVNLSHHILPFITYNGTHRIVEGMSIYGGAWDSPQGMGAWMLAASTGTSSGLAAYTANASLSRFYFECASFLSGEVERFSGQSTTLIGGSPTQCGDSGSLGPWMTPAYLNWDVSDGSLDGQVGIYLQINGDHNSLTHTDLTLGSVTDNGFENRVQTGINNSDANLKRAFYANLDMPQDPVGKLTGDFLLNGDSGAPFVSGSDLLTTCRDYRTLTPLCVNDPGGSELSRSYIHALATAGSVSGISTGSVASWNALMAAGSRIPLTQVYVVAQGRCQGAAACSSTFYVRDRVTGNTLGNCTYTFGSSWTVQGGASSNPCLINFSSVPMGDAVGWDTNAWTASGLTAVDISFVGFQPQHPDIVSEVLTSGQLAGVIQSGAAGVPVNITAANWHWGSTGPGVVDASSPTGYSTAIGNAWSLTAWNGSTNLNGGALYPAVPSTISYLVQAPAVLTNSLAAAMAATDTSLSVSVPVTSSYASGGCFQIDQEIACYSGALTAGATAIAVSRGQYGTLPQAHASGATVSTVGTGAFYAMCNATNYASTNVVFGANWSYVSSPFAAQNCSGASTAIHLSFANGPTGQTYKIAAVQIAQNSGNPQATSSNQVPISATAGSSQYGWTATKSLAGSGAAIPTGPAASTSGNITTFASGNGQIQDSGISLSSVASLSSASQQTFAGPIKINGSQVVYPEWYGAKGDGVTDDTAAFRAAFAALPANGGCVHVNAGKNYLITAMVDVGSTASGVQGNFRCLVGDGRASKIMCSPSSTIAGCFRILNGSSNSISHLSIQANSNVTSAIDVTVDNTGTSSTEDVTLQDMLINGGVHGIWLDPDNFNDVSHVNISGVYIAGASLQGIVVGNGQQGNVLDNNCYGCVVDTSGGAVLWQGGGLSWWGGGVDENTATDFQMTVPPDQPIIIKGVRSEGSPSFWKATGGYGAAIGMVSLDDDSWFSSATPDTYAISHNYSAALSITNSKFTSAVQNVSFSVGHNSTQPTPFSMKNVGVYNTQSNWSAQLATWAASSSVEFFSTGDYVIDASGNSAAGSSSTWMSSVAPGTGNVIVSGTALTLKGNSQSFGLQFSNSYTGAVPWKLLAGGTGSLAGPSFCLYDGTNCMLTIGPTAASGVTVYQAPLNMAQNYGISYSGQWRAYVTGNVYYIRDDANGVMQLTCTQGAAHAGGCVTQGLLSGYTLGAGSANQTKWDANGVKHEAGTAPAASVGTVTGTNAGGSVGGLSAATSVTVTFANSGWTTWSSCTASPSVSLSAAPYVSSISKTSVTFTFPSLTGTLYYQCNGN